MKSQPLTLRLYGIGRRKILRLYGIGRRTIAGMYGKRPIKKKRRTIVRLYVLLPLQDLNLRPSD